MVQTEKTKSKQYLFHLWVQIEGKTFQFKQAFNLARSNSEIQPAKLTNHSVCTNSNRDLSGLTNRKEIKDCTNRFCLFFCPAL